MKKKLLFTIASVTIFILGFVSCTNDFLEEEVPILEKSKNAATCTGTVMTEEYMQARLNELSTKYGIKIDIVYKRDLSEFSEESFVELEQYIIRIKSQSIENSNGDINKYIDDSEIDEFGIAPLSVNLENISEYEETLDFRIKYQWGYYYHWHDIYSYSWGLKFDKNGEHISINAILNETSSLANKTTCHVGMFHSDFVTIKNNNTLYFQFDFNVTVVYGGYSPSEGWIYGTYNDGFQNIYMLTYDPNLTLQ